MTPEFQQGLGIFFIAYPLIIILIMISLGKLPVSHPFVLLNWGLITMGAGLSTVEWLFLIGVATTFLFSLYSVLMLPTKEALRASDTVISELSRKDIAVHLYQKLLK